MKKKGRFLLLVLALAMVAVVFAGCKDDAEDPADTTPVVDAEALKGYKFTIAGTDKVFPKKDENGNYQNALQEQFADELDALTERLGIEIEQVALPEGDVIESLISAGMGAQKYADLIHAGQNKFWSVAKAGALIPLDDERLTSRGLNYADSTRWYQTNLKWTELFGHPWGLTVASEYVPAQTGYFITFNKELCASAGYDDMYQLVREKKWNWDAYREIARATTKDLDADGVPDIWGTGATAWGNEAISNGVQYIDEVDGKWRLTISSDAGIEALQFLYDMNYADGTRWDVSSGQCREAFANGTITFNWAQMGHINGPGETIYNSAHDYGIIPMPLGPSATEYLSMSNGVDAFVIQNSNQDLDKVVPIINEWALVVNDPENYLKILDDDRCRTEADKEMMITYIIPNYAINRGNMNEEIWSLIDDDGNNGGIISEVSYNGMTPAQAIEAYEARVNAALDKFFDQ